MTIAHNGIILKPIPYLDTPPQDRRAAWKPVVATATAGDAAAGSLVLSRRRGLIEIDKLFRDAPPVRAKNAAWPPARAPPASPSWIAQPSGPALPRSARAEVDARRREEVRADPAPT